MGTFLTGPEPRRGDVVWYNFTYNISLHSITDWVWIQRIWRKQMCSCTWSVLSPWHMIQWTFHYAKRSTDREQLNRMIVVVIVLRYFRHVAWQKLKWRVCICQSHIPHTLGLFFWNTVYYCSSVNIATLTIQHISVFNCHAADIIKVKHTNTWFSVYTSKPAHQSIKTYTMYQQCTY